MPIEFARIVRYLAPAKAPQDLAVCRILIFGFAFLYFAVKPIPLYAPLADVFWQPEWILRCVPITFFSLSVVETLSCIFLISLFCSCIGLATRLATFLAFVLGGLLFGFLNSVASIHTECLLMWSFVGFAFSPSGDVLSVDAWIDRRMLKGSWLANKVAARTSAGDYGWPIRFISVMSILMVFAAGMCKLRSSGIAWAFSDTLSNDIMSFHLNGGRTHAVPNLDVFIIERPWLSRTLALVTMLIEICSPAALFLPRVRTFVVISIFMMLVGFWAIMGISFPLAMICLCVWVPWSRYLPQSAALDESASELTVLGEEPGTQDRESGIITIPEIRHVRSPADNG